MESNKNNFDSAFEYYEKIRTSLSGLFEILKINFNENDYYYQAGIDNLIALNKNILNLLKNSYDPREVRIKLRELKFDEIEAQKSLPF
ncbi:MAG: hypothetical protein ACTSQJ_13565 [Promethearchaeota archaeon]